MRTLRGFAIADKGLSSGQGPSVVVDMILQSSVALVLSARQLKIHGSRGWARKVAVCRVVHSLMLKCRSEVTTPSGRRTMWVLQRH